MGRRKQPIQVELDAEGFPSLAHAQLDVVATSPSRLPLTWARVFDVSPPQFSRELRMHVFADTLARQLKPISFRGRHASYLFPKSNPHECNPIVRVLDETGLLPQTILDISSILDSNRTLATMLFDISCISPQSLEGRITRQLGEISYRMQSHLGIEPVGSDGSEFARTVRGLQYTIPDSFRTVSLPRF